MTYKLNVQLHTKRQKCNEEDLLKTIILLRRKRQATCSAARKKYLRKRSLFELVELLTPKELTENERKGRSSGNLSWKLSRGEQNNSRVTIF